MDLLRLVTVLPGVVVAILLGVLAWTLWSARRRDPGIRALAAFLGLVAANYALQALSDLVSRLGAGSRPPLADQLALAAFVAQLVNPVPLVAFAGNYPRRNALAGPLPRAIVAALAVALTALLVLDPRDAMASRGPLHDVVETYGMGAFALVAGSFLVREMRRAPGEPRLFPPGFLVAWAVVFFLRIGPTYGPDAGVRALALGLVSSWGTPSWASATLVQGAADTALVLAALALTYPLLRPLVPAPRAPELRRVLARAGLVALAIGALLQAGAILVLVFGDGAQPQDALLGTLQGLLYSARYESRWLFFVLAVGPALLTNRVVEIEARQRRRLVAAATTGVLLALLLAAAAIVESGAGSGEGLAAKVRLLGALAALAATQVARLGRRVAERIFPPQREQEEAFRRLRRFEVYRDAARAVDAGRASPSELERLRLALALSPEEARLALATRPAPAQVALQPGVVVAERYRLERLLGQGGHGRVFLAHDARDNRMVALKEMALGGQGGADAEILAMRRLDHPAIVPVHDWLVEGNAAFVSMGHMPGGSLADRLRGGRPLPPEQAVDVALRVLSALEAAHAAGIVHRDVKPSNVLFDEQGMARLSDFGAAAFQDAGHTATSFDARVPGTLPYLPPEALLSGAAPSPAWDVYAAGTLVFEALEGRLPAHEELSPPRAHPEIAAVVARARAPDPCERYPSARAMRRDLLALAPRLAHPPTMLHARPAATR